METKIIHDVEEHFHKGHAERHKYDPGVIIHYKIKINDAPYEVDKVEIEGKELAKLVELNLETHAIYAIKPGHKAEVQPNELVDLGGYGIEKFVTEPRHEHERHDYEIFVNAKRKEFSGKEITFEEVVKLAYGVFQGRPVVYTVTYAKGENHSGEMDEDDTVRVKDGMEFTVTKDNES